MRLAVVVSHPIQHFCPGYENWSRLPGIELRVFFASTQGLEPYRDQSFDRVVKWEGLTTDFPHEFLEGAGGRSVAKHIDANRLDERLHAFNPDVVIVYGWSQALQKRAMRWALHNQLPIFMIADSEPRGLSSWYRRLGRKFILPQTLKKPCRFLTVGDANEVFFRHYGVPEDRLIRTYFPIDTNRFDALLPTRQEIRNQLCNQWQIPQSHRIVLMVGKLVPWKRQIDLVRFSNNREHYPPTTVILAGAGPLEPELRSVNQKEGAGGVIFAGFVSPPDLVRFYCSADIYVHCSEHEPHSLAISEAIYSGLPVVLSHRCGSYGPTDDVQNGLNGLVYTCGDVEGLAARLRRLLCDDALRHSFSAESSKLGRAHQQLAHGDGLIQALKSL